MENVGRVVRKADELGDGTDGESGPDLRAAEAIFREAMVAESEVVADYLGGVLASARIQGGDDAVAWTAVIARMSSRELRLHYMLYSAVLSEALGHMDINVMDHAGRGGLRTVIPYSGDPGRYQALGDSESIAQLHFTVTGLERERLFEINWTFGLGVQYTAPGEIVAKTVGGVEIAPSFNGMNLYMWGHGMGAKGIGVFLLDQPLQPLPDIVVPQAFLKRPFPTSEVANRLGSGDGER